MTPETGPGSPLECRILRWAAELERLAPSAPGLFAGREHLPGVFLSSLSGNWAPRVAVIRRGEAIAGILYARERMICGFATGLVYADTSLDGMLCADPASGRDLFGMAVKSLLDEPGTRGIRLVVERESVEQEEALETASSMGVKSVKTEGLRHARLRLPSRYEHFLEMLGYKSRRNFRYYRRNFEAAGHSWVEQIAPRELPRIVDALRAKCRFPGNAGEIRGYVEIVARAQRPLIAGLRHGNGEWLGVVAGWYGPEQATLLFQLHDDLGFERDSLSVVLRAYLVETLIAQQAREMIFLNNVKGPLARYPDTRWVRTAKLYLDRTNAEWRMVRAMARRLGPLMPRGIQATLSWIAPFDRAGREKPRQFPAARTKLTARIQLAVAFLLLFAAAFGSQFRQGAYRAEFAADPDEPAHHVTGLMVRDYLASGLKESPLSYALDYYDHYPKVAIGHWPPVFYLEQAVWMLVFSRSGWAVLLLMAVLCGATATIVYGALRPRLGYWWALLSGLVFVSLPAVRTYTGELMTEIPVMLFTLSATVVFGCYLGARNARAEWKYAIWFGVVSSLAIMTKGSGFVLALLPVCGALLGRRWDLPRRWSFYAPAAIVIALCLPWYLLAPDARHESVDPFGGPHPSLRAFLAAPAGFCVMVGPLLAPLAFIGFIRVLWARGRQTDDEQPAAAAAMLLSLALFRGFLEVARDYRVLTIAIAPMLMLSASGLAWVLSLVAGPRLRLKWYKAGLAATVAGATILWGDLNVAPKPRLGYRSLVNELRERPEWRKPVALIVADAQGEGAFISEAALHETALGHRVIRGSKFLEQSDWSGRERRALFSDTDSLMRAVRAAHISLVVVDLVSMDRGSQPLVANLLVRTARQNPSFWTTVPLQNRQNQDNPAARRFLVLAVR